MFMDDYGDYEPASQEEAHQAAATMQGIASAVKQSIFSTPKAAQQAEADKETGKEPGREEGVEEEKEA